ncbi:MAG: malectin domain-containing carbohydrate-binding protein [Cyanobacteria bacterium P01_G01_bin.19]
MNTTLIQPPNPEDVLYRINAGGPLVPAIDGGLDWAADINTSGAAGNSPYLVSAGSQTYNNLIKTSHSGDVESAIGVPVTTPLAVFNTERFGTPLYPNMLWQFNVAADHGLKSGDQVEVRLYFAEIFGDIDADGKRVFDVAVEGVISPEFDDIDFFAEVGSAGNIGSGRTTDATVSADGVLDIEFIPSVQNPAIKAIEVVALSDSALTPNSETGGSSMNRYLTDEVRRFYQFEKGFHFYSTDDVEIDYVREKSETGELAYQYESEKFQVLADNKDALTGETLEGVEAVYRFFNTDTGSHLYTTDEVEKAFIEENLSNYYPEGIKYHVFESQPEGIETTPMFRLLNTNTGSHLFTIDQNELNYIQNNLPHFSLENEGEAVFYVFELES